MQSNNIEKITQLVNKNKAICFINIDGDDIDHFRNENEEMGKMERETDDVVCKC